MASRLAAPTRKPIRLRPVRPNAGIEAEYRRKLDGMVREMQTSLMWWLRSVYRAHPPKMASDRSPAQEINSVMLKLARRWQKRFDDLAPKLAGQFSRGATGRADAAFMSILKKGGFTVSFRMTPAVNDALQASIAENVGLIKSIASEHLAEVQGLVMRSVAQGRDLGQLTADLESRYAITRRRAAFIARDQNNKATAIVTRVRQKELGITTARWLHSAGGKKPRESHVKASGKTYDVDRGMLIDGEYIWPGQLPNCRCVSVPIIEGLT